MLSANIITTYSFSGILVLPAGLLYSSGISGYVTMNRLKGGGQNCPPRVMPQSQIDFVLVGLPIVV